MAFYGICPETAMVGDCNRVAKILEATNEGYFLGATWYEESGKQSEIDHARQELHLSFSYELRILVRRRLV